VRVTGTAQREAWLARTAPGAEQQGVRVAVTTESPCPRAGW